MKEHDPDLALRLQGYHLTTAEILYHLPDHPQLLQSFIWQTMDQAPEFPRLHRFLDYWTQHIEATLHSICLTHSELIKPQEIIYQDGVFKLN